MVIGDGFFSLLKRNVDCLEVYRGLTAFTVFIIVLRTITVLISHKILWLIFYQQIQISTGRKEA